MKRSVFDLQDVFGCVPNVFADTEFMDRTKEHRSQNEEVERPSTIGDECDVQTW